jgi:hypothetical protein
MKFTKKYILMSEADINHEIRGGNNNKSPMENRMSEFKNEMLNILNKSEHDESPETMYAIYQQLFSKYLNLNDNKTHKIDFQQQTSDTKQFDFGTENIKNDVGWVDSVTKLLPKNISKKGLLLAERIRNSDVITVNNKGEISVKNKIVPNSNIIDLITDFSKKSSALRVPMGAQQFARALKHINIPTSFIGNTARIKLINDNDSDTDDNFYDVEDNTTPKKVYNESSVKRKLFESDDTPSASTLQSPNTVIRKKSASTRKEYPYTRSATEPKYTAWKT